MALVAEERSYISLEEKWLRERINEICDLKQSSETDRSL